MNKLHVSLASLAVAGTLSLATMAPASADSAASTRNIILGAAALAGIAIESNVAHKRSQANAISGYLPDGSAVYGDGHVVDRNGYSYYPGNNGQNVSCNNGGCYLANADQNGNPNGYQNGNPNRYQNGNWNGKRNLNPNADRNDNHNGYSNARRTNASNDNRGDRDDR